MHRSGTSVLARLLNLLGVDLGPAQGLLEARPDNPKGFWEHGEIVEINERLLRRLGGSSHFPPAFPEGWERSDELDRLRQRARAVIERDFSRSELWGWKDPRTCLTMPFWQRLVPRMRFVVALRRPEDVARSLESRDALLLAEGVHLWLTYLDSTLRHTRGQPRAVTFYEDMISDWRSESRHLAAFIGRPSATDGAAALDR
jgi:hypothetical protein